MWKFWVGIAIATGAIITGTLVIRLQPQTANEPAPEVIESINLDEQFKKLKPTLLNREWVSNVEQYQLKNILLIEASQSFYELNEINKKDAVLSALKEWRTICNCPAILWVNSTEGARIAETTATYEVRVF